MDNDTLRRGRPTLHVVYGDGIAILAGDGLQAEAFALLAREPVGDDPALVARKLRVLAGRSPTRPARPGMVGGQAIDLQAAGQAPGHADHARRRRPAGDARAQDRRADSRRRPSAARSWPAADEHAVDGDRRGTRPSSASRFRSSTTSSTSKADAGAARQDRRQGRRRRQADLSGAVRPRALARAGRRLRRARARQTLDEAGLTDGWLGRSPTGWCRAGTERCDVSATGTRARSDAMVGEDACVLRVFIVRDRGKNSALGLAARRARPGAVARAGAGADSRRPGAASTARSSRRPAPPVGGRRAGRARRPGSSVRRPRRRQARARARRLRHRRRRPPGARHRRLDRRLHRRPAAARRARASSRSTSATASSTGGCAPIRASSSAKASTRAR